MSARSWLTRILIACVTALVLASTMTAQQLPGAELSGIVRDETGGPAPGATVTLTDQRAQTRTTTTDATGAYVFRDLPSGPYILLVTLSGFAAETEQIDLVANSRAGVDVKMRVSIEQRVEVVSSLEDFRRVTGLSPVGMTLGSEQLSALPNDPEIMLQVLRELSATSGRADEVTVYVDGQPVNTRLPPKEAIQSIRISTNSFASEFAEPSAGLVEIVTKPASTNFRGETQATFNDSLLNAQNFFESEKRPSRTQGYSSYLGGPIVPGRWSFLAYGGRWMRDERLIVNTTIVDPATLAIQPFLQSVETPNRIESYSLRTDVTATERNLISAEYTRLNEAHRNFGLESGLDLPERGIDRESKEDVARLAVVSMFGARVTNELRLQARSQTLHEAAHTSNPAVLVLDTFNAGGNQAALGQDRTTREASVSQVLSYNGDRHTFRGGVYADVVRLHDQRRTNQGGTFTFGGQVSSDGRIVATPIERYQRTLQRIPGYGPSTFTITRGTPTIDFNDWHVSWFAQDDLRPSQAVTISFGLRHDMQSQAEQWWLDVAPRAGIAWTPDGSGRHTLRAAIGLFYGRIPGDIALDVLRYDGVGAVELVVDRPRFFPAVPAVLDGTLALPMVRLKSDLRAPLTSAVTTSYEWQATKALVGSIGYTRRRGDRLLRSLNVNAPDPLTGLRARLDRGPMLQFESSGHSDSHQLRVTMRRALTRVSVFGTYVLGSARSDTDGPYTIPADSRTAEGEFGRSADDERHRFVLGSFITLPDDWTLSSLLTIGSGRPFNITTGGDDNGDLLFLDRPGAGSPDDAGATMTDFGSFDLSRGPGEPMIARNSGQGPSQFVLNVGVAKTVRFGGAGGTSRPYVIFTVSAENVTNRINFTDFNGVVTSPLFGMANTALNPRRVELSARFGF